METAARAHVIKPELSFNPPNAVRKLEPKKVIFWAIIALLSLVILLEIFIGIRIMLYSSLPQPKKIAPLSQGGFYLQTEKGSFKVGEKVPVKVKLTTGGKTVDSADLIVHFDPTYLQLPNSSAFSLGNIFKEYPVSEVDPDLNQIRISGTTPPQQEGFNGIGEFVTINFTAKKTGTTGLTIEYKPDSTIDSNIVQSLTSHDILKEVGNLTVSIKDSSSTENVSSSKKESCTGFTQYCTNLKGQTGTQFCRGGITVNNQCSFDSKNTISCDSCKINI